MKLGLMIITSFAFTAGFGTYHYLESGNSLSAGIAVIAVVFAIFLAPIIARS